MKTRPLHWTVAMGFFAVSAVVACTAETSSDATSNDPVTGSGAHPPGEVGARGDAPGAVETTATGLCDVLSCDRPRRE